MKISVAWLNQYLDHGPARGPVSAAEVEHALTFAGFPIESATPLPNGDICLDVEVTSNRGDMLSHLGMAREVGAVMGLRLRPPETDGHTGSIAIAGSGEFSLDNRVPALCRLFTAQIINNVNVGPSPAWLVEALASLGQRSINNVVDVTNFVALEYGQPSHVFDLDTIARDGSGRAEVIIRTAGKGETLKLLDSKTITLAGDELVVADPESGGGGREGRVISLAGVMGGAETEVTAATKRVLLEAATWDPVSIRRAARRFSLRTDASHRFERIVDPRTIRPAARRAATLIARLAEGRLSDTRIEAGPGAPASASIRLRPERARAMLGAPVPTGRIVEVLSALEIKTEPETLAEDGPEPALLCAVPSFRPDLTREVDLIEEVARVHGLDKLPVSEKVAVRVAPPQTTELAMRELARVLTGTGFYEAVTFTFVSERAARPFLPKEFAAVTVCDERRKGDPVLRPSALPSLLACRQANQDAGVTGDGASGVRLYETSAVFAQTPPGTKGGRGRERESRSLALLADANFPEGGKTFERKQAAVRAVRGTIEQLVHGLGGAGATEQLEFEPAQLPLAAFDPAAAGVVKLGGEVLGVFGVLAEVVTREYDLVTPVAAAELGLDSLLTLYPPRALVRALPQFPSIERDLSLVVGESVSWAAIRSLVREAGLPQMDDFWFVGTYRGQQVGAGRKSVTLRLRFRDPADARTLRHEEVDPQVAGLVERAKERLGAAVRV